MASQKPVPGEYNILGPDKNCNAGTSNYVQWIRNFLPLHYQPFTYFTIMVNICTLTENSAHSRRETFRLFYLASTIREPASDSRASKVRLR